MDYDLALHNTRVLNDGGSVPNPIQAESYIKYLKENNLWDSCVFFGLGGSKIDSNSYCSKLYDLKGNADLLQNTSTAQPKYNSDGSLLYDGGDWAKSTILGVANPIRTAINYITGICWFKTTYSGTQTIFARHSDVADGSVFAIRVIANKLSVWVFDWNWQVKKKYESSFVVNTGVYVCAGFTFNAITKILKVYVNGLEIVPVKTLDLTYDSPTNYAVPVSIGVYSDTANYTGISSIYQIYKTTFTPEQMLQNFNNIKPTDISETYGLLSGAHINRVETSFGSIPVVDKVQSTIDKLKSANLWDSCVFFADARIGVKKDSNQYVNAVYDLKANADLLQSTATRQPKYDNGNLLYDGGDTLNSSTLPTNHPIRTAVSNFTIIGWVKMPATSGIKSFFNRYNSTNYPWILSTGSVSPYYNTFRCLLSDSAGAMKFYYTTNTIADNTWHRFAVTFSPNSLKMYVDNTECTYIKNTDNIVNSVRNVDNSLNLSLANPDLPNGSQSALYQIYNSTFTNEQLTWNYNNIRPEGV